MAKTSMIVKQQREPKFSTRKYTRCQRCGRPHSVYRKFGLCRVCFRELALSSACAVCASASWRSRASFPASRRPAGKSLPVHGVCSPGREDRVRQARSLWVTEDRLHEFI